MSEYRLGQVALLRKSQEGTSAWIVFRGNQDKPKLGWAWLPPNLASILEKPGAVVEFRLRAWNEKTGKIASVSPSAKPAPFAKDVVFKCLATHLGKLLKSSLTAKAQDFLAALEVAPELDLEWVGFLPRALMCEDRKIRKQIASILMRLSTKFDLPLNTVGLLQIFLENRLPLPTERDQLLDQLISFTPPSQLSDHVRAVWVQHHLAILSQLAVGSESDQVVKALESLAKLAPKDPYVVQRLFQALARVGGQPAIQLLQSFGPKIFHQGFAQIATRDTDLLLGQAYLKASQLLQHHAAQEIWADVKQYWNRFWDCFENDVDSRGHLLKHAIPLMAATGDKQDFQFLKPLLGLWYGSTPLAKRLRQQAHELIQETLKVTAQNEHLRAALKDMDFDLAEFLFNPPASGIPPKAVPHIRRAALSLLQESVGMKEDPFLLDMVSLLCNSEGQLVWTHSTVADATRALIQMLLANNHGKLDKILQNYLKDIGTKLKDEGLPPELQSLATCVLKLLCKHCADEPEVQSLLKEVAWTSSLGHATCPALRYFREQGNDRDRAFASLVLGAWLFNYKPEDWFVKVKSLYQIAPEDDQFVSESLKLFLEMLQPIHLYPFPPSPASPYLILMDGFAHLGFAAIPQAHRERYFQGAIASILQLHQRPRARAYWLARFLGVYTQPYSAKLNEIRARIRQLLKQKGEKFNQAYHTLQYTLHQQSLGASVSFKLRPSSPTSTNGAKTSIDNLTQLLEKMLHSYSPRQRHLQKEVVKSLTNIITEHDANSEEPYLLEQLSSLVPKYRNLLQTHDDQKLLREARDILHEADPTKVPRETSSRILREFEGYLHRFSYFEPRYISLAKLANWLEIQVESFKSSYLLSESLKLKIAPEMNDVKQFRISIDLNILELMLSNLLRNAKMAVDQPQEFSKSDICIHAGLLQDYYVQIMVRQDGGYGFEPFRLLPRLKRAVNEFDHQYVSKIFGHQKLGLRIVVNLMKQHAQHHEQQGFDSPPRMDLGNNDEKDPRHGSWISLEFPLIPKGRRL